MMTILTSSQRSAPSAADVDNDLAYMMQELDQDGDGKITFQELKVGMQKWLREVAAESKKAGKKTSAYIESTPLMQHGEEGGGEGEGEGEGEGDDGSDDDDEDEVPLTSLQIMQKSALLMLGGSTLVAFFSGVCARSHMDERWAWCIRV